MNLLARIKNYFSEEIEETNLDWKEVALDLNRELIETREEKKSCISVLLILKNY